MREEEKEEGIKGKEGGGNVLMGAWDGKEEGEDGVSLSCFLSLRATY
jgi:hypothetical protein